MTQNSKELIAHLDGPLQPAAQQIGFFGHFVLLRRGHDQRFIHGSRSLAVVGDFRRIGHLDHHSLWPLIVSKNGPDSVRPVDSAHLQLPVFLFRQILRDARAKNAV